MTSPLDAKPLYAGMMFTMDVDATSIRDTVADAEERVRCAGCGVRAVRLADNVVINPGPGTVLSLCVTRRPIRGHGPWLPDE